MAIAVRPSEKDGISLSVDLVCFNIVTEAQCNSRLFGWLILPTRLPCVHRPLQWVAHRRIERLGATDGFLGDGPTRAAVHVLGDGPGGNCIKIGLPGELILGDYFQ